MADTHEMQEFDGIDRARWERERAALNSKKELASAGVQVEGDKGIVRSHGIEVSYEYDEAAKTLKLQTLKTPWYIGETVVDQAIHNQIEGTK